MNHQFRERVLGGIERIERRPAPVGVAAMTLVIVALVALFFGVPGGGPSSDVVEARFDAETSIAGRYQVGTSRPLILGSPVRVDGVTVGRVQGSRLAEDGRSTVVTMTAEGVDVRRDASAALSYRTLLGGNFQIELDPGSRSAPGLDGHAIPTSRTYDQVAFDDLFQPFNASTRSSARRFFGGLDTATGSPRTIARAVHTLGPTTARIAKAFPLLRGTEVDDLSNLVVNASRVTTPLADDAPRLSRLVRDADNTFAVTSRRSDELGRSFELAPSALAATDVAVRQLDLTLDRLDPLASALRPGARQLAPTAASARRALDDADTILADAKPLFRDLRPTATSLRGAADTGLPLIRTLSPVIDRLNDETLPQLDRTDPESGLKTYEAIGPTFGVASGAASGFDRDGYLFAFPDLGDANSIGLSPCTVNLSNPEKLKCEDLLGVIGKVLSPSSARSKAKGTKR